MIENFDISEEGYTCPHCGNNSIAALLSTCCRTAQQEREQFIEDNYIQTHEYAIPWPKAWGKPPQWLSLQPWPKSSTYKDI